MQVLNMKTHPDYMKQSQTGAALVISLLILLVMTLIGVTAMSSSNLEEKMAGNSRDTELAFEAAEASLRGAENVVSNLATLSPFVGCTGSYLYAQGCFPDVTADATWATAASFGGSLDKIKTTPKYIIEYTGDAGGSQGLNVDNYGDSSSEIVSTFRVTARGTGGTDKAVVLLQSFYGKIF
jgi:type IV pilus assembly protein PilX